MHKLKIQKHGYRVIIFVIKVSAPIWGPKGGLKWTLFFKKIKIFNLYEFFEIVTLKIRKCCKHMYRSILSLVSKQLILKKKG